VSQISRNHKTLKIWLRSIALAGVGVLAFTGVASAQTTGGGGAGGPSLAGGGGVGGGAGGAGMGGGGMGGGGAGGASGTMGPTATASLGPTAGLGPTVAIGGTNSLIQNAGSISGVPSTANPWRTYYNNVLQLGLSTSPVGTYSSSAAGGFGQPLYSSVISTQQQSSTAAISTQSQQMGFSTWGMRRAPSYYTALSEDLPVRVHAPAKLKQDLYAVLQRSSSLPSKQNIEIQVQDSVVILRGQVSGPRERRLAEALIRLSPGVYDVQNELQIAGSANAK
jgi:hypothetical protein